jgi:tetratricopeptide (TPR) repeat protein
MTADAELDAIPLEQLDDLWDFDDPAASEERFRSLVPRARTEAGGALLAELLSQLARAQGLQRRFDDAEATLREAQRALAPGDARARIRILLERGRVANTSGRDGRGRESFLGAWDTACGAGEDALAVDAAHMLGIVEAPDVARRWNERAMELARSSQDPLARRWIGSLASNMGWARHAAGDDDGAISLFELARDEWLADGRTGRAQIARWSIARCLRSRGDVRAALQEQELLLAELDAVGETDGYVHEEVGECLLALGRPDDARASFARAWSVLREDPHLRADEPERLARLERLALGGD